MKPIYNILIAILIIASLACCNKNEDLINDGGLDFYLTKYVMYNDFSIDYDTLNIDTIALCAEPFISYEDIRYYDTSNFSIIIGLKTSKSNIEFEGDTRMFVATLNNNPIYCGFLWNINLSYGSNWTFMEDPLEANGLEFNELRILTNNKSQVDVLDPVLLERLLKDKKSSDNKMHYRQQPVYAIAGRWFA